MQKLKAIRFFPKQEYLWGSILENKPRCYPQQRLGNKASKENLRARLFPSLGEVS